jgi:hypothetical protein
MTARLLHSGGTHETAGQRWVSDDEGALAAHGYTQITAGQGWLSPLACTPLTMPISNSGASFTIKARLLCTGSTQEQQWDRGAWVCLFDSNVASLLQTDTCRGVHSRAALRHARLLHTQWSYTHHRDHEQGEADLFACKEKATQGAAGGCVGSTDRQGGCHSTRSNP